MIKKTEFEKYAIGHARIKSTTLKKYSEYLTPMIVEEREMNITAMSVFDKLMMNRVIFIGTPIEDEVANIIQAQLLFLESIDKEKLISLYINSPGGSCYDGLGIYDTMQYVTPPISTTCTGLAASMASVLLCAGTKGKRFALPHSRVLIHQPSGGVFSQATDIEIVSREINKLKKEIYEIIVHHTGQEYDKVFADGERDYWMRADEAKEYGLIDKVLIRNK